MLQTLLEDRFVDRAPRQIVATLLDENIYLCSASTMYRVLRAEQMVRIPLKECIDSGGKSAPIPFECAHRFRSKTRRVSPWHETVVLDSTTSVSGSLEEDVSALSRHSLLCPISAILSFLPSRKAGIRA